MPRKGSQGGTCGGEGERCTLPLSIPRLVPRLLIEECRRRQRPHTPMTDHVHSSWRMLTRWNKPARITATWYRVIT